MRFQYWIWQVMKFMHILTGFFFMKIEYEKVEHRIIVVPFLPDLNSLLSEDSNLQPDKWSEPARAMKQWVERGDFGSHKY